MFGTTILNCKAPCKTCGKTAIVDYFNELYIRLNSKKTERN
ncbi:hypothetical protein GLIP_0848 [Aliiglaciecola lipolytica E3]|uniref:Uncharacterized protein n=1 Tax=Aliiglaciecola lipolytica E3 TaxID=1127673 RepID=K6YA12_9ALTE|nr:hypothetical protein GLIP_0848 [Aliiglaciecola lipolytica E3]